MGTEKELEYYENKKGGGGGWWGIREDHDGEEEKTMTEKGLWDGFK